MMSLGHGISLFVTILCLLLPLQLLALKGGLILLAIAKKIPVNVPKIIMEQMKRCVTDKKVGSWYFPKLVTALCSAQNVYKLNTEASCVETKKITVAAMNRPTPDDYMTPGGATSVKGKEKVAPVSDSALILQVLETVQAMEKRLMFLAERVEEIEKNHHERYSHLHTHICHELVDCDVAGIPEYVMKDKEGKAGESEGTKEVEQSGEEEEL